MAGFAEDGDSARFRRVFELSVTTARGDEIPAIVLQDSKDRGDLHLHSDDGAAQDYSALSEICANVEKLVRWLKALENGELRQAAASGQTPYDTGWMWQELGMRPE